MSAELLREAATKMREQHGPEHERHRMWSAMADWVDHADRWVAGHPDSFPPWVKHAEAVARAYLGHDSDTTEGTR